MRILGSLRLHFICTFIALNAWGPVAQAADHILVGDIGSGSALHWPIYIALKKGIFSANNIDFEWLPTQSSSQVAQQTAAGSLNLGMLGIADAIRAADAGAPIKFVRVEIGPPPFEILAEKNIKSIAGLRGKTIMIGGAHDISRFYWEDIVKANGLKLEDFDYIYAGSTTARYAALVSGSIAATILSPPLNYEAASHGFNQLARTSDFTKGYPFTLYVENKSWAAKNPAAISHFRTSYAQAVDWFLDKNNRNEAINILIHSMSSTQEDAEKSYEFLQDIRTYDRTGDIASSGIESFVAILKKEKQVSANFDVDQYIDKETASSAATK